MALLLKATVAEVIAALADFDPEAKVNVMYESSTWGWNGEESVESIQGEWTDNFSIKQTANGTVMLGKSTDLEGYK